MAASDPTTQTINVTEARQSWSQLLNRVFRSRERVIVEKSGIPVAALISVADLERFEHLERERARDFAVLDEIGAAFAHETPDESERQARRAVDEVRNGNSSVEVDAGT